MGEVKITRRVQIKIPVIFHFGITNITTYHNNRQKRKCKTKRFFFFFFLIRRKTVRGSWVLTLWNLENLDSIPPRYDLKIIKKTDRKGNFKQELNSICILPTTRNQYYSICGVLINAIWSANWLEQMQNGIKKTISFWQNNIMFCSLICVAKCKLASNL